MIVLGNVYFCRDECHMRPQKTIKDIFDNMSELQQEIAYEMIGQALEDGVYDREALVMFNKEEQMVMHFLLSKAMTIYV